MNEHKIRKAFELEHLGNNPHTKRRNEFGDYVLPSVQDAWDGWHSAHNSLIAKLATACMLAEVSDGQFESVLIHIEA